MLQDELKPGFSEPQLHYILIYQGILIQDYVVILARSARSPSFDVRLHGSPSIPIASFVERSLFIKTCHRKYLNRRIVYISSGHQGTFNPAVITNKEVHMVHGHINTNDETSHTTSNVKKRSLEISDYFSKQNRKPSLSGE